MVLNAINTRMTCVIGCSLLFGGIPINVVGVLTKLSPSNGKPVLMAPDQSVTAFTRNLWYNFRYFELTEITCQDDAIKITATVRHMVFVTMLKRDNAFPEKRSNQKF